MLTRLDESDAGPAAIEVSDATRLNQGLVFVPWPGEIDEHSSANLSQWLDRLDWIGVEDRAPPSDTVPAPAPAPSDEEATPAGVRHELDRIAAELGRGAQGSAAMMTAVRRIYAARHHPDRVPPEQRLLATRRMMIANMMIDTALREARE